MVTKEEYEEYFGQSAPSNFPRLEFISLNTIKSGFSSKNPICSKRAS